MFFDKYVYKISSKYLEKRQRLAILNVKKITFHAVPVDLNNFYLKILPDMCRSKNVQGSFFRY